MTLGYLNGIFCWNTILFCTISPLTCSRVLRLTAPDTRHKHLPTFTSLSRMQPGLWCVVTSGDTGQWCGNQGKLSMVTSPAPVTGYRVTQPPLFRYWSILVLLTTWSPCHQRPSNVGAPVNNQLCTGMMTWPSWTGAKQFYFHSFPEFNAAAD